MRIGAAILAGGTSSGFAIAAKVFSEFHAHQADSVRSSATFSVGMGVAPMAWQHRKDVVFTPKGERIVLPMLGRLPVFPPPLDDQIEHGNKKQIQHS